MPALGKPKPLCVDCKIRPMKLYFRCWECLKEYEWQLALNSTAVPIKPKGN